MSVRVSLFVVAILVGPHGHAAHAQATSGAIIAQGTFERFVETADGDWQTTISRKDGTEAIYTFVPATKIEPQIVVTIGRDPGEARFLYRYELVNGLGAQQQLAVVYLNIGNPVRVTALPEGWIDQRRPGESSVILRGPLVGEVPSGVPPGHTLGGIVVESPGLPGIGKARASGNRRVAVVVPPGLDNAQYMELVELSKQSTVDVPVIIPSIGAGVGEPELGLDVLLVRIASNYVAGFLNHEHPQAPALEEAFRGIYGAGDDLGDERIQHALHGALEISQRPVQDPWHQQMSSALEVCVRAVLEGLVPDRRSVRPDEIG